MKHLSDLSSLHDYERDGMIHTLDCIASLVERNRLRLANQTHSVCQVQVGLAIVIETANIEVDNTYKREISVDRPSSMLHSLTTVDALHHRPFPDLRAGVILEEHVQIRRNVLLWGIFDCNAHMSWRRG